MNKIIAFDCDGTLQISNGPVPVDTLKELQKKGWRVGICGNWKLAKKHIDSLDFYVGSPKTESLEQQGRNFELKIYVADTLEDEEAAREANWRFIYAQDFDAAKVLKNSTR
jgi:hypothetical protein